MLAVGLSESTARTILFNSPLRLTSDGLLCLAIFGGFASAAYLLKGHSRGRVVFLCCGFLALIASLSMPQAGLAAAALVLTLYTVPAYFLNQPNVNEYFRNHASVTLEEAEAVEPVAAPQIKYPKIKKCVDLAAAIAIVYPGFAMLWSQYENAQSPFDIQGNIIDLAGFLEVAAVALCIPAAFWLWWRQISDPPGAHPVIDKLLNDRQFMILCIVYYVLLLLVLQYVLTLIRR